MPYFFRLSVLVALSAFSILTPSEGKTLKVYAPHESISFVHEVPATGEVFSFLFGVEKNRAAGYTSRYLSDGSELFVSYRGRVTGQPVSISYSNPSEVKPINDVIVVKSFYRAKFRMRSKDGIVIEGILESRIRPIPPARYGKFLAARYRGTVRFHGTISHPHILGIKDITFTLKKTLRWQQWHPDGP